MTDDEVYQPPDDLPSLKGLFAPAPWMEQGRCKQLDVPPDVFFPDRGGDTFLPKSICAPCPVREQCLDYALDQNIKHGIWGGRSERERRPLRRQRQLTEDRRTLAAVKREQRARELRQAGWSVTDISRELGLHRDTVSRYFHEDIA